MQSIRAHGSFTAVFLAVVATTACCMAEFPSFKAHTIGHAGNKMGQTSLVDVDKDGDLDWVVGCRNGSVWWFEFQSPSKWVRHEIGDRAPTDVGGCAFDVDGDGWIDQVSGGAWYRNPGNPRESKFARHGNGAIGTHDNIAADVDGDGKLDLVAMSDKQGLFWYSIPADPTREWTVHRIGDGVHGGVDPQGVGDIDGDGDNDVVRSQVWFENRNGKGTDWKQHKLGGVATGNRTYAYMTKTIVVDFDGDKDLDVVQADGDVNNGQIGWMENRGNGATWTKHIIEDSKHGQDFHSLCVADFDNDGDLDVMSGGGPLSSGTHKWFIWERTNDKGTAWQRHEVLSGKRCHEAMCGDVDGDGDIDVCSKPWNGDEHVFLENLSRRP